MKDAKLYFTHFLITKSQITLKFLETKDDSDSSEEEKDNIRNNQDDYDLIAQGIENDFCFDTQRDRAMTLDVVLKDVLKATKSNFISKNKLTLI